ncbi:BON domain-containing protein, partial [candidate division GN15 bacterium]|nr:BON domain-containing protein [candidate division GN15 bacterium]
MSSWKLLGTIAAMFCACTEYTHRTCFASTSGNRERKAGKLVSYCTSLCWSAAAVAWHGFCDELSHRKSRRFNRRAGKVGQVIRSKPILIRERIQKEDYVMQRTNAGKIVTTTTARYGTRNYRNTVMRAMIIGLLLTGFLFATSATALDTVDDIDITSAIEADLWTDDAVNPNNVDIETVDGVVTLSGTTDNVLAKERASAIAAATVGVRSIVNRIKVKPTMTRTDTELATSVNSALLTDPAADSYEIDITVNNGIVTLTGTVESWQEKQLAATVVKGVAGVRGVQNDIAIDYEEDRPDMEIKADITKRLANDIRVDDNGITVDVTEGAVDLGGTVGSLTEKNRATADAWVAGVKSVNAEDMDIRWWARDEMRRASTYVARSDEQIKSAVEDAFLFDPRLLSFNPDVTVDNGTVTLTGTVDNLQAKQAAEQDARNTVGVWRVKNHLKVRPDSVPTNAELETRVNNQLADNPHVSQYDVA